MRYGGPLPVKTVQKFTSQAPLEEADRQAILALPHDVRAQDAPPHLILEGDPTKNCRFVASGFAFR